MCEILDSCTQWEGSGGMTKCEGTTKEQALRNSEKREALVRDERNYFVSTLWRQRAAKVQCCLTTTTQLTT